MVSKIKLTRDMKVERRIHGIIDKMNKEIGVNIPNMSYPVVLIASHNARGGYNPVHNIIVLNDETLYSGNFIGGEIGHFIRDHSCQDSNYKKRRFVRHLGQGFEELTKGYDFKETYTSEFFDKLGRRILQKIAKPEDKLDFSNEFSQTDKEAVSELKELRHKKKAWEEYVDTNPDGEQYFLGKEQIKLARQYRKNTLVHTRPYKFAEQVDLGKLDLKRAYMTPDKEVRERFFREDPQYDFDKPIESGKVSRRTHGLEGKMITGIIAIIGFFVAIISLSSNLTGFVILGINQNTLNFVGWISFIVGLIGSILFLRYRK